MLWGAPNHSGEPMGSALVVDHIGEENEDNTRDWSIGNLQFLTTGQNSKKAAEIKKKKNAAATAAAAAAAGADDDDDEGAAQLDGEEDDRDEADDDGVDDAENAVLARMVRDQGAA